MLLQPSIEPMLKPELAPEARAVPAATALAANDPRSVDARSEGEFVGVYTGDDAERPGTIPGSRHLPHDWVSDSGLRQAAQPGRAQGAVRGPGCRHRWRADPLLP